MVACWPAIAVLFAVSQHVGSVGRKPRSTTLVPCHWFQHEMLPSVGHKRETVR